MVPNLLERVVESEAELMVIAESVRIYPSYIWIFWIHYRSRKEILEQNPMTLKVWNVWSSTGSPCEMVFYSRPSLKMSRRTVGSITLLQAPFSAQPVLIGMTPSELPSPFKSLFWYAACERASKMMKSQWQAINSHFWYMLTACMILRNLGKDCFGISCLFGYFLCLQRLNIQSTDKPTTSRPSSIYLLPRARLTSIPRQQGLGTLAFMVWHG
jgi:hypothetical protein